MNSDQVFLSNAHWWELRTLNISSRRLVYIASIIDTILWKIRSKGWIFDICCSAFRYSFVALGEGGGTNCINHFDSENPFGQCMLCFCRTVADKASKLESTVEIYRKKLEDLNDFRRQVKSLQETNMMYMHNTVSLEEELKKANAARAQLETYKRQVRN